MYTHTMTTCCVRTLKLLSLTLNLIHSFYFFVRKFNYSCQSPHFDVFAKGYDVLLYLAERHEIFNHYQRLIKFEIRRNDRGLLDDVIDDIIGLVIVMTTMAS